MNKLFQISNKIFYNINTTVLLTSKTNYNEDIINLINKGCEVIVKNSASSISELNMEILEKFKCEYLKNANNLTKTDEIKINILSSLISTKKIIAFFNVLTYVNTEFKKELIKELEKQGKIVINYTSEIEETLLLEYIMVVHGSNIIMEGNTKAILNEEKIIKKLGFNLPFILELSNGLKYYGLIDTTYYTHESLVNALWK